MKSGKPSVVDLVAGRRPLVIGHRGYSQFAPENTLPSFQMALAAGADLVELDYHHSQDGQLVVIHDPELDRTTNATARWRQSKIKVANRTAAEMRSLDAGGWFDAKFAGTRIPLLSEALDTIQAGGIALIERKAGPPAACIQLLRARHAINRVVVQAFDWEYLRNFHDQEPAQILGALGPPSKLASGKKPPAARSGKLGAAWLEELAKTGASVAVWNRQVSKPAVQLAQDRGLRVWIYTINDPGLANRLLDWGVNGIITNNPSLIWRTIALRDSRAR